MDPAAYLAVLGLPASASASRVLSGHDAATWRVETRGTDGAVLALRVLPPGRDGAGELAALRIARERGVPVAELVATATLDGRTAIATTWLPGRPIGELLDAGAAPEPLGRVFGAAQRALHRPGPDASMLCHLDYQSFNVLVADGRVTGVVDWANARLGDPRDDLATTRVILAFAAAWRPDVRAATLAFADAWRAGYGRTPPVAELAPHVRAAAEVQLRTWEARTRSGQAGADALDAARAVVREVAESPW